MVWAKLDDEILDNPKIAEAGVFGFALHVAAITWCCRNLTDGFIPRARVRCLLDFSGVMWDEDNAGGVATGAVSAGGRHGAKAIDIADHLVDVGLWKHDPDGRGYWLHDFLDYNPSREKVLAERDRAKKRRDSAPPEKASPKRPPNVFGSSAERRPSVDKNSDGPDPDPVPLDPPNGGSRTRAREGFEPESESKVRVSPSLDSDKPPDWFISAAETVAMNTGHKATGLGALWLDYRSRCERKRIDPTSRDAAGWLASVLRREARDPPRTPKDHTPKYDKPTAGQTSAFQAELRRRLEEEAKKGAA